MQAISGIITGVISSFAIFAALYMWRPNIEVAKEIVLDKNKNTLKIKIKNNSNFEVIDLSYNLVFCVDEGDGIVDITKIDSVQRTFPVLNKHDTKDKQAKYAIRLSFDFSKVQQQFNDKDNVFLLFRLMAKHRFSNGTLLKDVVYKKKDIIEDGIYGFGDDMVVIRKK